MSTQKNKRPNSKANNYVGQYKIISPIGSGYFANIFLVEKENTKKMLVLKQIPINAEEDKENIQKIQREACILANLNSNYIIKYYDSILTKTSLNIVTEFCENGDLDQYLTKVKSQKKRLNEKTIWKFFIQTSLGLHYLHQKKILHRDIKTKNIFLTKEFNVRIGDLGIAKILLNTPFAHTFIGTPYYLSPEVCNDVPYDEKSDVWSLGCVLYEMAMLKHPYEAKAQVSLIMKIINEKYEELDDFYSKDLKEMITLLLEKDYEKRPRMEDVLKMKSFTTMADNLGIYYGNRKEKKGFGKGENNNNKKYLAKNVFANDYRKNSSKNKIVNNEKENLMKMILANKMKSRSNSKNKGKIHAKIESRVNCKSKDKEKDQDKDIDKDKYKDKDKDKNNDKDKDKDKNNQAHVKKKNIIISPEEIHHIFHNGNMVNNNKNKNKINNINKNMTRNNTILINNAKFSKDIQKFLANKKIENKSKIGIKQVSTVPNELNEKHKKTHSQSKGKISEIESKMNKGNIIKNIKSITQKRRNNSSGFSGQTKQKLNNTFTLTEENQKNNMNKKEFIDGDDDSFEEDNTNENVYVIQDKPKEKEEISKENDELEFLLKKYQEKLTEVKEEMKAISSQVTNSIFEMYSKIDKSGEKGDSDDIIEVIQNYITQNINLSNSKEYNKLFINYVLAEIKLKSIEKQLGQIKI